MQEISQIIIVILFVIGFFTNLRKDFNGQNQKEPGGFEGAVVTIIVSVLIGIVYWKAGLFSTMLVSD